MTTFRVPMNLATREFDTQYPIILYEKGVSQQEYTTLLNQCSELYKSAVGEPTNSWKKNWILLMLFVSLAFIIVGTSLAIGLTQNVTLMFVPFSLMFLIVAVGVRNEINLTN